ncbi:MAG: helix-turn-helix domain-containing protein [Gemmatimonadales bacterium]
MIATDSFSSHAQAVTPLAGAVMEAITDGIVVFDTAGQVVYANAAGRRAIGGGMNGTVGRAQLLALGGRSTRLRSGSQDLGEVIFLAAGEDERTLAERERRAILDTLEVTEGKLVEAARRLGISRTTLWRRLKAYGLDRRAGRPTQRAG